VHVRAAIGSPVTQTNCHPFRHGRWLFVHNGYVGDFKTIRRDLMMAIDPELFGGIMGSTDTEVVFRLALTFGLEEDPIRALEHTVGLIEATATERGVAPMVQGTFGVSDGSSLWATRYATEGRARSLFVSADVDSLHELYPDKKMWFATARSEDRLIASEPFSDLPGVWHEIDESSAVIVRSGGLLEHEPFHPQVPRATVSAP
jgi:predicted glutamine amidotransferase